MAEKGRAFVLQITVGGVMTTIAGQQTTSFTINNEMVDVTNKGSAGKRVLLENAGVGSVEFSATGTFEDDAGVKVVRNAASNNTHVQAQIIFETGDIISGTFGVANLQFSGEYNGADNYNLTLNSSGAWTYTG